jgi:type I restriction enzyme M protein
MLVTIYHERCEETRYARRVPMAEVEQNGYSLNSSRYVSATAAEEIDPQAVHQQLVEIEEKAAEATARHNQFLPELELPLI